jgi:hypothetical protein
MKNKFVLIPVLAIALAALVFLIFRQANFWPHNPPADFNFIFRYGVGAKNELNTFSQTYTKDMVMDPPVTVGFKLTDDEIAGVNKKMNDLKVFGINEASTEKNVMVTPCSNYYFKAQIGFFVKELSWDGCHGKINDELQQFTDYIIKIIEAKEEYKKLPSPKGGYL